MWRVWPCCILFLSLSGLEEEEAAARRAKHTSHPLSGLENFNSDNVRDAPSTSGAATSNNPTSGSSSRSSVSANSRYPTVQAPPGGEDFDDIDFDELAEIEEQIQADVTARQTRRAPAFDQKPSVANGGRSFGDAPRQHSSTSNLGSFQSSTSSAAGGGFSPGSSSRLQRNTTQVASTKRSAQPDELDVIDLTERESVKQPAKKKPSGIHGHGRPSVGVVVNDDDDFDDALLSDMLGEEDGTMTSPPVQPARHAFVKSENDEMMTSPPGQLAQHAFVKSEYEYDGMTTAPPGQPARHTFIKKENDGMMTCPLEQPARHAFAKSEHDRTMTSPPGDSARRATVKMESADMTVTVDNMSTPKRVPLFRRRPEQEKKSSHPETEITAGYAERTSQPPSQVSCLCEFLFRSREMKCCCICRVFFVFFFCLLTKRDVLLICLRLPEKKGKACAVQKSQLSQGSGIQRVRATLKEPTVAGQWHTKSTSYLKRANCRRAVAHKEYELP